MKSTAASESAGDDPAVLSIGEVSRRTGIPVSGLRNWEQRHGLPRPERLPNGRRRYRESDCALLAEVLRGRDRGLSLSAAVAHALSAPFRETSIFAGLRRRHPGLQVHVMTKSMLLAVTHAIEDECCARAQRPVLMGAFQRERFYRAARPRWADLAGTAEQTVVFADFGQRPVRPIPPAPIPPAPIPIAEIPIAADSPLRREWALICDADDHPACLAGWERPGQEASRDADRTFEMVWSVDPQVVRSAARIGAGLAAAAGFGIPAPLQARLGAEASACSADLRRASGLMERTFDYLSRATTSAVPPAEGPRPPRLAGHRR